jgi:hypothetical protein
MGHGRTLDTRRILKIRAKKSMFGLPLKFEKTKKVEGNSKFKLSSFGYKRTMSFMVLVADFVTIFERKKEPITCSKSFVKEC